VSATAPRRLSREARREQLVAAALPSVARQGFTEFSFDEVAARAGVTRNLLYHYFPKGRPDLVVEVVALAQRQITSDWLFDESVPLADRVAANFARVADHALRPTHAWLIHRRSRSATTPELRAAVDRFDERAISAISTNQFGTPDPPRMARLALKGYLAFAETVLDEALASGMPRPQVMQLLAESLAATLSASVAAS
jgi:AcrR family transcriptional regulator